MRDDKLIRSANVSRPNIPKGGEGSETFVARIVDGFSIDPV